MKFRKKPVVIEARLWDRDIVGFIAWADAFTPRCDFKFELGGVIAIATLEGEMTAQPGDYIIRGVKGEFYPCKPDIFAATYEAVDEKTPTVVGQPT